MKKQTKTNLGTVFAACLFKCDFMNIYKVFQLGKILFLFPCKFYWNPDASLQISVNILIFSQSQFTKRVNSFSLLLPNSFEMTFPVLNEIFFFVFFLRNSCRGVHSHSNGDKTSFSFRE